MPKSPPIIGHEDILNRFANGLRNNNLLHGYLFSGQSGLGKTTVAREIARMIYCPRPINGRSCLDCNDCRLISALSHPSLIFVAPTINEKSGRLRQISIDVVREAGNRLKLTGTGDDYKLFLMDDAHLISEEAVNSLLKTLEEPRGKTVIILITHYPELLPATILSRLADIRFHSVPKERLEFLTAGKSKEEKAKLLFLAAGRPGWLIDSLKTEGIKMKNEAEKFFEISFERKFFLAKELGGEVGRGELFLEALMGELRWRLARAGNDGGKLKPIAVMLKILSSALDSLRRTDANARLIFESAFLQINRPIIN